VDIHIDPSRRRPSAGAPLPEAELRRLREDVLAAAKGVAGVRELHRVYGHHTPDGPYVTFHCLFDEQLPLRVVHDRTLELEMALRRRRPDLSQIVIHPEPAGAEHADHDDREPIVLGKAAGPDGSS